MIRKSKSRRELHFNFVPLLIALALLGSVLGGTIARAATPTSSPVATSPVEPVVTAYQEEVALVWDTFPRYELDLQLDDVQSTLSGTLTLTYPNVTGDTLTELPLRLYPNAGYYGEGETSIDAIEIDGLSIAPRYDESGTVLFLDLPTPLLAGGTLTATIAFTTVIPRNSDGSYGILNHDLASERFVLADWYPVVAGRDETGWRLEPPTFHGDPTFSTTSRFDVHLRVPDGYAVISTGNETLLADGLVQIESGPAREFALVVARGLTSISQTVGETEISVYVSPGNMENGQRMLDLATAALAYYDRAFGPYPYRELDFVEVPLSLALGVSWSGVLFIDAYQISLPPEILASLDFTILHEIGHQWWGSTIGANSNDHTWMVEGLTNATAVLAQSAIQGPAAATDSLYAWVVTSYLNLIDSGADGIADLSIFEQPPTWPMGTLAYGKGALGFLAIRNAIGDDAFMQGLAAYAEAFRFGIAEPADLLAAFQAASGQDLVGLWNFWFESAQTTRADIEALVPQIIASLPAQE
jgi:hypothetical protein